MNVDLRAFARRATSTAKSLLEVAVTLAFMLFVFWCSAGAPSFVEEEPADDLKVVAPDTTDPTHRKIVRSLHYLWERSVGAPSEPQLAIVVSNELNAASLGRERFVVWEEVGRQSPRTIDGILAHEIGHDLLRHKRDQRELQSVTKFVGEVLSLFMGQGPRSDERMQDWVEGFVVPSYTRRQEAEADARAVEILDRAGYMAPDSALARALGVLLNRYGDTGGGFFDTHPATSERITRILE